MTINKHKKFKFFTQVVHNEFLKMAGTKCTITDIGWSHLITALHWMQGSLVARKMSVCLSVCPSVCQTHALWRNGRNICPDFYTVWKIM